MPISRKTVGDIMVIELSSALDHSAMAAVKNTITEAMSEGRYKVVIDLGSVSRASLLPVGLLVEEKRKLQNRGGDLKLAGLADNICEMLDRLGTGEVLCQYDSVDEAISDFGKPEAGDK